MQFNILLPVASLIAGSFAEFVLDPGAPIPTATPRPLNPDKFETPGCDTFNDDEACLHAPCWGVKLAPGVTVGSIKTIDLYIATFDRANGTSGGMICPGLPINSGTETTTSCSVGPGVNKVIAFSRFPSSAPLRMNVTVQFKAEKGVKDTRGVTFIIDDEEMHFRKPYCKPKQIVKEMPAVP